MNGNGNYFELEDGTKATYFEKGFRFNNKHDFDAWLNDMTRAIQMSYLTNGVVLKQNIIKSSEDIFFLLENNEIFISITLYDDHTIVFEMPRNRKSKLAA